MQEWNLREGMYLQDFGATENARPSKMQVVKMRDMIKRERQM